MQNVDVANAMVHLARPAFLASHQKMLASFATLQMLGRAIRLLFPTRNGNKAKYCFFVFVFIKHIYIG